MARYRSLNHVPKSFRTLGGAPLTLEQVNSIIEQAEKGSTGPEDFAASLGRAKKSFKDGHSIVNGVWKSVRSE